MVAVRKDRRQVEVLRDAGRQLRTFNPESLRGCGPSIPARTHDELLLHLQQKFAQGYPGLNVRSCRLASRSTSTRCRHACCCRLSDGSIRPGSSGSFVTASSHASRSAAAQRNNAFAAASFRGLVVQVKAW